MRGASMEEMNSLRSASKVTLKRTGLLLWEGGPREPGTKRIVCWISKGHNSKKKQERAQTLPIINSIARLLAIHPSGWLSGARRR